MSGIQHTTLFVPDQWSASWFRTWVVQNLARADVRNAIGYGLTITADGNSVATITADAETAGAIGGHNLDPFAHAESFNAHASQPNPHPVYPRRRETESYSFFVGR